MIRNYLLLGFRNLLKNKLASIINISGLGMAIGCCLVVFVFLSWFYDQDNFHTKRDSIYVVEEIKEKNNIEEFIQESPGPIGLFLKKDYPKIKDIARLDYMPALIKNGDNIFRENIAFADNSFHSMFDFPVKWGSKSEFNNASGIVLTEDLSLKLFGHENPVGKSIQLIISTDSIKRVENFAVQGVYAKRPQAASFFFSCIVPFTKYQSLNLNKNDDWSKEVSITFLEMNDTYSTPPAKDLYKPYIELYNSSNINSKIVDYHFQPLKDMSKHSYKLAYSYFANTHPVGIIMLTAVAIGILLLVCFNYMNIAIASASGRLKEIGVRKVLGSERRQIIYQFLIENTVTCILGVAFGLLLAKVIFIPWFSKLAYLDLNQGLLTNKTVWFALILLTLMSILGGAAYPAFYVSGLRPISIVRGKLNLGNKNLFRKVLLGFQYCITFLGISMALAFIRENKISRSKPWGYEPMNTVTVKLDQNKNYDLLKSSVLSNDTENKITGSVQSLGNFNEELLIRQNGKEEKVNSLKVMGGFVSQFNIEIINGRDLQEDNENDQESSILVNQAYLRDFHLNEPIGKSIEYDNRKYTIVGIVNDFRYEAFDRKIEPLVMMACKPEEVKYAYIKTRPQLTTAAHSRVESIWKKSFPDLPFDYTYQDKVFENYFIGFSQVIQVLSAASLIMILASIFGIFGLALLILSKKMKDISVRKVLGANSFAISYQIIKEFIFALVIACAIGVPISWLLTKSIFNQFSPESILSSQPLIYGFMALLLMTISSMLWHLYKALTANPVKALRSE